MDLLRTQHTLVEVGEVEESPENAGWCRASSSTNKFKRMTTLIQSGATSSPTARYGSTLRTIVSRMRMRLSFCGQSHELKVKHILLITKYS